MSALVGLATLVLAIIGAARVALVTFRGMRRALRALARVTGRALLRVGGAS